MYSPDRYVDAMRFAAAAHNAQKQPGSDLPYLVHVVSVASEVIAVLPHHPELDADLAVTCALLHDTVEDTNVTLDEISALWCRRRAAGVSALTKNGELKDTRQDGIDSLRRIKDQPREIAIARFSRRSITTWRLRCIHGALVCAAYRVEAGPDIRSVTRARCSIRAARTGGRVRRALPVADLPGNSRRST